VVVAAPRIHRHDGRVRVSLAQPFPGAPVALAFGRQIVHPHHDRAHGPGHEFGRPRTLHAVGCHIIHLAVVARIQPGLQACFEVPQIDIGNAHVGKAQPRAPSLDGAR
jgi:hypothetical protein